MPDWRAYVRDHLGPFGSARAEQEQLIAELAAHLEDFYADLLAKGIPESDAFARTCDRAGNWDELRGGIVWANQEANMNQRVRQLLVPSLITLLFSYMVLALLQWAGVRPIFSHPAEPRGVVFYLPWLFLLPLIGAGGAYLSRRAQAIGWRVYFAACLPALALAAIFLLLFPISFVFDRQVPMQIRSTALVASILNWVILPGTALCLGALLQGLRKNHTAAH